MNRPIGQEIRRPDAKIKVTGSAIYTGDVQVPGLVHAQIVPATIARGRVVSIDMRAAAALPGVLRILTHGDDIRVIPLPAPPLGQTHWPLTTDRIAYEGQPIALVLAESAEQARAAAEVIRPVYAAETFETDFRNRLDHAFEAHVWDFFATSQSSTGDADKALADSPVTIVRSYETAARHHNPIEPSTIIADWRDDGLDIYDSTQNVGIVQMAAAAVFGLDPENVRVRSSFVGGGFGGKGLFWPHEMLAVVASRAVGRPVKLSLTRAQTFTAHGCQTPTLQQVSLAATRAGKLTAIRHTSVSACANFDEHVELTTIGTRALYDCPSIETRHRAVRVDRQMPCPMRTPAEGPGFVALESAIDELAEALRMDPLTLRLNNIGNLHPTTGLPFSSRHLRECYEEGARRFGWQTRDQRPQSHSKGDTLVGWGMASATMRAVSIPATVRAIIDRHGHVRLETATQDIGAGTSTILPQIAADVLGVPVGDVELVLGDTRLPPAGPTAGSSGASGLGGAVMAAANALVSALEALAGRPIRGDHGAIVAANGRESVSAEGSYMPAANEEVAVYSCGAVFAEVEVDRLLPVPRVTRVVGVYDAGRILNPLLARGQIIGGITWGIGQALLESSEMDPRLGRYLAKNLSGYLVPTSADAPDMDISFMDIPDLHAGSLGVRGLGELGGVGIGAAILNAIHHATGVRLRSVPVRLPRLLDGLPI